jgi:hypothetical protein
MASIVDDEMLDQFVPSGTYEAIASVMKQRFSGLSTMINFPLPDDSNDDELAAAAIKALQG